MTTLDIKKRAKTEDNEKLRKAGFLPAVVYGKKTPSTPISVSTKDFLKVWKTAGESGVVSLKGDGLNSSNGTVGRTSQDEVLGSFDVLIHEVSYDPVSDAPIHVDFYAFEKGKKIEVDVPLEFVGTSGAVKDLGGSLVKVLREIKISADPMRIPHSVAVDISALVDFTSQIVVSDLKLPEGVDLVEKPEEVVASVAEPKADEPEETAPVDLSAIEVEKKGKVEKEGEAGAEASAGSQK